MFKQTMVQILDNLSKKENVLRLLLVWSLLVPYAARPQTAVAQEGQEVGVGYDEAVSLIDSADPTTYLPAEARHPFSNGNGNGNSGSPFGFMDDITTNPFDMLPTTMSNSSSRPEESGEPDVFAQINAINAEFENAPLSDEQSEGNGLFERGKSFFNELLESNGIDEIEDTVEVERPKMDKFVFIPFLSMESGAGQTTVNEVEVVEAADFVYESPDGRVKLTVPPAAYQGDLEFDYANVNVNQRSTFIHPNALVQFNLSSRDATYLQDSATIELDADGYDSLHASGVHLTLLAWSGTAKTWYPLPTEITPDGIKAHAIELTMFALVVGPFGADKDPCAEAVEIIPDADRDGESESYKFLPAKDTSNDVIPSLDADPIFHPEDEITFDNYRGTEIILSGTDTGDPEAANPDDAADTHTESKIEMSFEMTTDQQAPDNAGPLEREHEGVVTAGDNDITEYIPQNKLAPALDGTEFEELINEVKVKIELSFDEQPDPDQEWGSTGYYLIRKDFEPPNYLQVYTYHDGEGGVNIYLDATDNCAIKGVGVNASNPNSGGMSAQFQYLAGAEDGQGLYRAAVQLDTEGTNTYEISILDMADYNQNNKFTFTMTEPATNQAGEGISDFSDKCKANCGCQGCSAVIGDPVATNSGNFTMSETDVVIAGIGDTDIDITRHYNSKASSRFYSFAGPVRERVGIFGIGWTSPFQFEVELVDQLPMLGGPGVKVVYPDGHSARYSGSGGELDVVTAGETNIVTMNGPQIEVFDIQTLKTYRFEAAALPSVAQPTVSAALVEEEDANGNKITYAQGAFGPESITNESGRTLTLVYDSVTDGTGTTHGLLKSITGPEGLSLTYAYDTANLLLTSVNDERGQLTAYTYDGQYRLTNIKTPKGHDSMALTYTADNRVDTQTIGTGETYNFAYNDGAGEYTITDALGNAEVHTYDAMDRVTAVQDGRTKSESYTYDSNNWRSSLSDKNSNGYNYSYDTEGNIISTTGPEGYSVSYTYNGENRPLTITDSEGRVTQFGYDGNGNLLEITNAEMKTMEMAYDGQGQPIKITDYNGNEIEMAYTAEGDLASVKNGAGETVSFTYDGLGRMTTMSTHEGHAYTFAYDVASELLSEVSGPLGYSMEYTYDANGNIASEKDARENVTLYQFDQSENVALVTDARGGETAYTYDNMNNLTQLTDAEGRITTYTYDAAYNLTAINAPEGRVTAFEYDGESNITKITDGEGRGTVLAYDGRNRLELIKDALDGETSITYDNVDNIESITDANGNETAYVYDALDRLLSETNMEGEITSYEYDDNGNLTAVTDAEMNLTELAYDKADRLISIENAEAEMVTFAYDSLGNIVELVQPNGVPIHWEYDALYRPIALTQNFDGSGASDAETNVTYTFSYDLNGNLTGVTDPLNNASGFTYDELNRLTEDENALTHTMSYEYDNVGNLVKVTDRRGAETALEYDGADRLIKVEDALDGVATYGYDNVDNLVSYADENGHEVTLAYDGLDRLDTVTNPEGDVVDFEYDAVGNLTLYTDARGAETTFVYDTANRLTSSTDDLGGVTALVYDEVGNVTAVTDANGHTTAIVYDKAYRTTSVTDAAGFVTAFVYDENGNVTDVTDGNGHVTTVAYDALDRITDVTNAMGEVTQFTYDAVGNLIDTIEADGVTKRYQYDAIYQLTGVTLNADGAGETWEADVFYEYAYDENGNLTMITDPRNSVTQFAYDALNRVSQEINPLEKVWDYTYDDVGNLLDRTDGNRETTKYDYYDDDQLKAITYSDSTTVQFTYDANNNLTKMKDWLGETAFTYDELNRVTEANDALGRSLQYDYDNVGNITQMTYPHGGSVEYTYYENDWLHTLSDTAGNITEYERNGVGQMTAMARGNGTTTTAVYDKADRLLEMGHYEADGAVINKTTYTLNEVGLRDQATVEYGRPWPKTTIETYEYDGLRRLTAVHGDYDIDPDFEFRSDYAYDAAGNRVSWQVTDDQMTQEANDAFLVMYTYNKANQLTESVKTGSVPRTVTTFQYDDNGNRVHKEEKEENHPYTYMTDYGYDRADRLTAVTNYRVNDSLNAGNSRNREETVMAYDGMGRRLVKAYSEHDGRGRVAETEYVFDGLDIVAEYPIYEKGEAIGRDNHRNEFYLDDQRQIVTQRRFPNGVADQTYQYHSDGRRDVVSLSDDSTRAWVHYDYDAYGQLLPEWGNYDHPEQRNHNQFTFSGQEWDSKINGYEYYARLYQADLGSWGHQDQFRGFKIVPESLHRYGFVHENPVNYYDSYGFAALAVFAIAAVGGAVVNMGARYVGDVIQNSMDGKKGLDRFKPKSSLTQYVGSAVTGAIGGAVSVVNPVAGGFIIGAGDSAIDSYVAGDPLNFETGGKILFDGVIGAATAGIGSKIASKVFPKGVSGRIAKGLKYFVSKRAIREYMKVGIDALTSLSSSGVVNTLKGMYSRFTDPNRFYYDYENGVCYEREELNYTPVPQPMPEPMPRPIPTPAP